MNKPTITLVIPVYNEAESLEELYRQIVAALAPIYIFDCIFVDDASTDGSFDKLIQIKKEAKEKITIIRFRKHLGKSPALAVGFSRAKGFIVATLDADLQDDPKELPKLIRKLGEGYQLVSGWRRERHDKAQKKFVSRFFNRFVRFVTGVQLHDFNTGLKVYKNQVVKEIALYGELHRYIPVLAAARGFRVTEVPVVHHERKHGKSKYGVRRIFQAGFDFLATWFLISFKQRPMQLFGMIGSVIFLIGIAILVYLSYLHFIGISIGRRPLLIFGVLALLFGVQLISTGLLAEMLTNYNHRVESYPIDEVVE
jgi:glycosyltransferase involved in cell wall biosynthesis